jgi:hypothetical protein
MPDTAVSPVPRSLLWPLIGVGTVAAIGLTGAVLLWAHYGTTVFFETIRAGFSACFG